MPPFTARNVVKFLVTAIVRSKVADLTKEALTEFTSLEEDSLTVKLSSQTVGWLVSDKLSPVTDRGVDIVGDFIAARFNNDDETETKSE